MKRGDSREKCRRGYNTVAVGCRLINANAVSIPLSAMRRNLVADHGSAHGLRLK